MTDHDDFHDQCRERIAGLEAQLAIMDDMATDRNELTLENARLIHLLNRADFYTEHLKLACVESGACQCGLEALSDEIHRVTIKPEEEK